MSTNRANVTFSDGTIMEVEKGTTIYELSKLYQSKLDYEIVGAEIEHAAVSMEMPITRATKLDFVDLTSPNGYRIHKSGLQFVIVVALKEAFGEDYNVSFNHSIANGLHMTITGEKKFTLNDAKKLKAKMNEIINNNERIYNMNVESDGMINYLNRIKEPEKAINLHNLNGKIVTMYKLRNYLNYFYSEMPYSTGCLKTYDLVYLGENKLVLLFPTKISKFKVPEYIHYQNVIKCFDEGQKWIQDVGTPYISDLNGIISDCKIEDFIKIVETHFNNEIHDLVDDIIKKKSRYVLFAGPSSTGKTTSTKKIALELRSRGYDVYVISTDDYFKEREESPRDENGKYDFECLECLDLKLLNKQLKDLIAGKKVNVPTFNFVTGKKEYSEEPIKLAEDTIILIEGLHSINDAMTPELDSKLKYKVYLSPFIPINIDRHNYLSTTDLRLMRRIVRDNRSRACDVGKTIAYWSTVRGGEQKYIYPYINTVDKIINTSLIYEMGVLKVYVEPLLYSVKRNSPSYSEARRLINFLKNFFPIPSDYVPGDSILREFIGKSIFENYK
ncbi:MAG: hypothetical protein II625_02760 [Bacilli bacterium]|nr:hypothetical protein [Bacilli bacterium]